MTAGSDGRPPMISYLDVAPLLLAACPSFRGSPESRLADPADGEYLFVGHLATHIIRLLNGRPDRSLPAVSDMIEWILVDGDAEARALLIEGLLEPLLDPASYRSTGRVPADLYGWLGTRARALTRSGPTGAAS